MACDPEGYPTEPRIAGETTESSLYKAVLTWMAREHSEGFSPGTCQPRMDVPWLLTVVSAQRKGGLQPSLGVRTTGPKAPPCPDFPIGFSMKGQPKSSDI